MQNLYNQVKEAAGFIREKWKGVAKAGIVLGTGIGNLAKQINATVTLPYSDIPHFPRSTVESHAGNLIIGSINNVDIIAMEGRFHAYEGYTPSQITFPIRVIRELGADTLFVSNACGGMNPQHQKGDIVVIEDHINLLGLNPLVGINDEKLGPRFPDMCEPYDKTMIEWALEIGRKENFVVHKGVYVAVLGPNLETRAEYRFLRGIGADVVGMSTVPEVIVAIHAGMKVLGLSIITDMCLPDAIKPAIVEEIIAVANEAEPKLTKIICGVIKKLSTAQ
ncbi:MAG: purine-nucleoside phosphorylase [Planctomycetaceae bacterium]|jgi:purine-nucleoside phosphorylase|nr:purine-nucleoside phosphorylase [Planctomycetaceae bacterium]